MNSSTIAETLHCGEDICNSKIMQQYKKLKSRFAIEIINSVPNISIVINCDREVVLYNNALKRIVSNDRKQSILGLRPGELLNCGNATNNKCGESISCNQCGAYQAIEDAFSRKTGNEECMLLSDSGGMIRSYTFKVIAVSLQIDDELFCIVHLNDISDRKNKEIVEKIFLHDLMNAVSGIASAGGVLKEEAITETNQELAGLIVDRALFMANEINAHRLFISAENNQLEIHNETISVSKIIETICTLFASNPLVKDKNIKIIPKIENFEISTDKRILYRILENIIKNALEASPMNKPVLIEVNADKEYATFTINNQGTIPITVAQQIFKRSFTTKGKGRGLGTYSVKMFTENYLHGKVWFDSSREDGTNFYIKIPLNPIESPFEN